MPNDKDSVGPLVNVPYGSRHFATPSEEEGPYVDRLYLREYSVSPASYHFSVWQLTQHYGLLGHFLLRLQQPNRNYLQPNM